MWEPSGMIWFGEVLSWIMGKAGVLSSSARVSSLSTQAMSRRTGSWSSTHPLSSTSARTSASWPDSQNYR